MKSSAYHQTAIFLLMNGMAFSQNIMAQESKVQSNKVVTVEKYNKEPENPYANQSKTAPLTRAEYGSFTIQNADGSKKMTGTEQKVLDEMEMSSRRNTQTFTTPKTANALPEPPYETPSGYGSPPTNYGVGPAGHKSTSHQYPSHSYQSLNVNPAICSAKAGLVGIRHFKYAEPPMKELVWSGFGTQNEEKYKIHRDAKDALHKLVNGAKADGIILKPSSIFRSVKRQQQIINKKLKTQEPREVYYSSSPAGYSEHHTGLAVDFGSIDERFTSTRAYEWLLANARRYGWEQTFTAEYSAYSGVSQESWHWRYVGQNNEFAYLFEQSKQRSC